MQKKDQKIKRAQFIKYDNFDALDVAKISDLYEVPADYEGLLGVVITAFNFIDEIEKLGYKFIKVKGVYAPSLKLTINKKPVFKRLFIRKRKTLEN